MRGMIILSLLALAVATSASAGDSLFDAAVSGDKIAVERLLANGANVDSRAGDQETPLISAALAGQSGIIELLLKKGADLRARNSGGFTALHAAAYGGSLEATKLLVERGALIDDAVNKAGVTPLMVAGEEDHVAVAEFLIAQGAAVGHPEIHGYLPITRALWKGNADIVRLYKRHGATCPPAEVLGSEAWHQKCVAISQ